MADRGVLLTGPFTDEELAMLASSLRLIERHRPDQLFTMLIIDGETGMAEAEEIVKRIFPPQGRPQ